MDEFKNAYNYLNEICEELKNKNRYFPDKKFNDYLEIIFKEKTVEIDSDCILYRARNISKEDIDETKKGTKYEGYDSEGSFVNFNSKWPSKGRMNPQGIYVLYVASDIRTAITELHPYLDEIYSVATLKPKDKLKIADLSQSSSNNKNEFTRNLSLLVQERISKVGNDEDYVFPQYVAAFCKSLGYDGIAFRSKYATKANVKKKEGLNYTIFNYDKCEVTGSKLYKVGVISVPVSDFY